MGYMFDGSVYGGKVLCKDVFYFSSRFRTPSVGFPLCVGVNENTSGFLSPLMNFDISLYFNDLMVLCNIGGDALNTISYDQYLLMEEQGLTDDSTLDLNDVFCRVENFANPYDDLPFISSDELHEHPVLLDLGNRNYYISIHAFFSELQSGNLVLDGETVKTQHELLESIACPSLLENYIYQISEGFISADYPIDLFNYIRPLLTNPFLYPDYLDYIKSTSVSVTTTGGTGGDTSVSSGFTDVQAALIVKALSKLVVNADPFERNTDILDSALDGTIVYPDMSGGGTGE